MLPPLTGPVSAEEPHRRYDGCRHSFCSNRFNALTAKRVGPVQFPAGLFKETSGWVCRLYANDFDQNPGTIILEHAYRMYVQGGRQPTRFVKLPLLLGMLIRKWRDYVRLPGVSPTPIAAAIAESIGHSMEKREVLVCCGLSW